MTLDAAALRARGLNILPAHTKSKVPAISWKVYQSMYCSMDIPPEGNAVVVCGETSNNLYVLDLDSADLYGDFSEFHDTYTVKTKKGYHLYFRWAGPDPVDKGYRVNDSAGRHIDLQGQGTYVIAEGSVHPDGPTYTAHNTAEIADLDPRILIKRIRELGFTLNKTKTRDVEEGGVTEGNRNQNLFNYCRYMISRYNLTGVALRHVADELNAKNDPPLPDSDVETIVKQAPQYATPGDQLSISDILDYVDVVKDAVSPDAAEVDVMQFVHYIARFGIKPIISTIRDIAPAAKIICGGDNRMRHMRPEVYGIPEAFNGMVVSADSRQAYIKEGSATCPGECGNTLAIRSDEFHNTTIPTCANCRVKYKINARDTEMGYIQKIVIQELLEESEGNDPVEYEAEVIDDHVGEVHVGDRLRFIARFRTLPDRNIHRYRITLGVLGVYPYGAGDETLPTEEEVERWKSWGDIYDRVIASFAPNLVVPVELKENIAYILRGGRMKPIRSITRHIPHLLLMGDRSSGKSTIMETALDYLPGASYNDSTNVSAVGLTIGMKNMRDGTQAPRAGLLPMHSGNVIGLDEIDKMGERQREAILCCMEFQYVTMSKIGSILRTRAEVGIMCGGNPRTGKFSGGNVADAFGLDAPFMSRFDTVWLLIDNYDPEFDMRIARLADSEDIPPMDRAAMRRYFAYVRTLAPEIPKELRPRINSLYLEMRRLAKGRDIDISQRQRHGLYRLVAASAAMNLRETATDADVDNVVRVTKAWMASLGDYELNPAESAKDAKITFILDRFKDGITREELDMELNQTDGWTVFDTDPALDRLRRSKRIESRDGKIHLKR